MLHRDIQPVKKEKERNTCQWRGGRIHFFAFHVDACVPVSFLSSMRLNLSLHPCFFHLFHPFQPDHFIIIRELHSLDRLAHIDGMIELQSLLFRQPNSDFLLGRNHRCCCRSAPPIRRRKITRLRLCLGDLLLLIGVLNRFRFHLREAQGAIEEDVVKRQNHLQILQLLLFIRRECRQPRHAMMALVEGDVGATMTPEQENQRGVPRETTRRRGR